MRYLFSNSDDYSSRRQLLIDTGSFDLLFIFSFIQILLTRQPCGDSVDPDIALMAGSFDEASSIYIWDRVRVIRNQESEIVRGCSCDPLTSCTLPKHFPFEFVKLNVLGPYTGQSMACSVGSKCPVSIKIATMEKTSIRIKLAKDCGHIPKSNRQLPQDGLMVQTGGTDGEIQFEFSDVMATKKAIYQICVCIHNWNDDYIDPWIGKECEGEGDFRLDVGEVQIHGEFDTKMIWLVR